MTDLLFDSWWLPLALIALGAIVWYSGNKRTDNRIRWVGFSAILLGLLLVLCNAFIETETKQVTRKSKELVQSVFEQDWEKTKALLDPNVYLQLFNGVRTYKSRDELLAAARVAAQQFGLHAANTTIDSVKKEGQIINVNLRVLVVAEAAGQPVPSTWQFEFEKDESGQWTVHEIQAIQIGGPNTPSLQQYLPTVK